jgi:hypothetical protein
MSLDLQIARKRIAELEAALANEVAKNENLRIAIIGIRERADKALK